MKIAKSTVSFFPDIDEAIFKYTQLKIEDENVELEELIFSLATQFSSMFWKSDAKTKKNITKKRTAKASLDIRRKYNPLFKDYSLAIDIQSDRYTYVLYALLKAQIEINETVMHHFMNLCKRAHSLDYIESRAEAIYHLLFDEWMDKSSSPV